MFIKFRYLRYYAKYLLDNRSVNKDPYAQHGKDKLVEILLPKGITLFIDIGANDEALFSNTYKFAKMMHEALRRTVH